LIYGASADLFKAHIVIAERLARPAQQIEAIAMTAIKHVYPDEEQIGWVGAWLEENRRGKRKND
jgi:hypothetical protein